MSIQNINDFSIENLALIFKHIDLYLGDKNLLKILSLVNKKFNEAITYLHSKQKLNHVIYPLKGLNQLLANNVYDEVFLTSLEIHTNLNLNFSISIPNIKEEIFLNIFYKNDFNDHDLMLFGKYAYKNQCISLLNAVRSKISKNISLNSLQILYDNCGSKKIFTEIIDCEILSQRFTLLDLSLNVNFEVFDLLIKDQKEYFIKFNLHTHLLTQVSYLFDAYFLLSFQAFEKIIAKHNEIFDLVNEKLKKIFTFNSLDDLIFNLNSFRSTVNEDLLSYLEFFIVYNNLPMLNQLFKKNLNPLDILNLLSVKSLTLFHAESHGIETLDALITFFVPFIYEENLKELEKKRFNFDFSPSLLFKSIESNNIFLFEYLIKNYTHLINQKYSGSTLIHYVIKNKHHYYIKRILPLADCNILESITKKNPLHYACSNKETWKYIPKILKKTRNISNIDSKGNSPLHLLIKSSTFSNKIFRYIELLNIKDNHNFNHKHFSPFFYACNIWDDYEAINKFHELAKNYLIPENKLGNVALYYCRKNKNLKTINEIFYSEIFHLNKRGYFPHFPIYFYLNRGYEIFSTLNIEYIKNFKEIPSNVYVTPELMFQLTSSDSKIFNDFLYLTLINYNLSFFTHILETKYDQEFFDYFIEIMVDHSKSLKSLVSILKLPISLKNLYQSKFIALIEPCSFNYLEMEYLENIIQKLPIDSEFETNKKNITTLFNCIKERKFYIGTPKAKDIENPTQEELNLLNLFYDDLQLTFNHFLHFIFKQTDLSGYILLLAEWSTYCATRWKNELEQFYYSHINYSKNEITIPQLLQKALYEIKIEILYEIIGNETHDINEIKYLIGEFIGIDKGYLDPIKINEESYDLIFQSRKRYLDEFLNRFHSVLIAARLLNFVEETLRHDMFSSIMLEYLKNEIAPDFQNDEYNKIKLESLTISKNEEANFRKKYNLSESKEISLEKAIDQDQFDNFFDKFIENESYRKLIIRTILYREGIVRNLFINHEEDWKLKESFINSPIYVGQTNQSKF